ncbi:hypothetical protein KI659_00770 [Litoribacter alkaliphilus]|uniref:Uncharacterized protein n=1 Tax=Litoribacter ruber TaxID=702568 RepID=A0AAP2CG38_9BACT|nr:hypothetical protein [Litoribacter alkaliphilus]MBS9522536.1 hypothetical protein [Litoribacter alkaliphilus]
MLVLDILRSMSWLLSFFSRFSDYRINKPLMKYVMMLACLLTIASCQPGSQEKLSLWNSEFTPGCYSFSGDGSTIAFEVKKNYSRVEGSLSYDRVGKGRNTGYFEGHIEGDMLIGTYTFRVEGKERVRQVAFRYEQGELKEGLGILGSDGKTFRNVNQLDYSSSPTLKKTDCFSPVMTGTGESNELYSQVNLALYTPEQVETKLRPINKQGQEPAYLIFNTDNTKAEIFFPGHHRSMVLRKTHQGNWANSQYTLSSLKGYTLYHNTDPIYNSWE